MSISDKRGERTLEGDIESFEGDLKRYLEGNMTPVMFKAKRVPMGVYEQRQAGSFMQRVRAPGGRLTSRQAQVLAAVASKYSSEPLHATTRQDIQLHGLRIEDLAEIMREIGKADLSSRGGGGNTVRNILSCTYAGLCPAEKFDVSPYVDAVTEYMVSIEGSYNLPRKYKIAFSGCACDCASGKINDLGFISVVKDGRPGFRVVAGGGMGSGPRIGSVLEEWIPAEECLAAAEALRRVFDQHGDRKNRKKARLRFVFERNGYDQVLKEYLEHKEAALAEGLVLEVDNSDLNADSVEQRPQLEQIDGAWFVREGSKGKLAMRLFFEAGLLPAEHLGRIAEITSSFSGTGRLRLTVDQGILIESVDEGSAAKLAQAVTEVSPAYLERQWRTAMVACAGAATCRLGLCLSRGLLKGCEEYFEDNGISADGLEEELVRMNGCPNACGKHLIGGVGLSGAAKRNDGQLYPAYSVFAGGKGGAEPVFGTPVGTVPAKAVPAMLADIIALYRETGGEEESFSAFVERFGADGIKDIVTRFSDLPNDAEQKEYHKDWGSVEDFSLAGRGAGECGAGVFEVVSEDIDLASELLRKAKSGDLKSVPDALIATSRSLLIVKGVDESSPDGVLRQFEKHFIDTGLLDERFRTLIVSGRSHLAGSGDALRGKLDELESLHSRVQELYDSLDSSLNFALEKKDAEEAKPAASDEYVIDLKGVACPINFVKAKLKLETVPVGDVLAVTLDDGEPVQNVPASFKQEGQEVVGLESDGSGHWTVRVKRLK